MLKRGIYLDISFLCTYSTLGHLPPLRFHCVGGCWDRTQPVCSTVGDLDLDPDLLGSASFLKAGSESTQRKKLSQRQKQDPGFAENQNSGAGEAHNGGIYMLAMEA
jgi:hypothetical protein